MTSNATSAAVREQLIQALELDLVGPSPALLAQLEAEGRTEEATELREELRDRPPNRWYQSGFPPTDPDLLTVERYKAFLAERRRLIAERLNTFLGSDG